MLDGCFWVIGQCKSSHILNSVRLIITVSQLSGGDACTSYWYWYSWGYYWGGYWYSVPSTSVTQSLVGTVACGKWRTTLSFSFIGGWFWLMSGLLVSQKLRCTLWLQVPWTHWEQGIYICTREVQAEVPITGETGTAPSTTRTRRWFHKNRSKTEVPA